MPLTLEARALARGLLALERAGARGVLHVQGHGQGHARLGVLRGDIVAIEMSPDPVPPLGDWLARASDLDAGSLVIPPGGEPPPRRAIGRWLVRHGLVRADKVSAALNLQLEARLAQLLSWEVDELRFDAEGDPAALSPVPAPPRTSTLLLDAATGILARAPLAILRGELASLTVQRTEVLEQLAAPRFFAGDEATLLDAIAEPRRALALVDEANDSSAAVRFLTALIFLGAASRPAASRRAVRLLTRKRAELRRGASPSVLLDGADPRTSRRALRRIARELHPDRMDADSATLSRASARVLGELSAAEGALRSSR